MVSVLDFIDQILNTETLLILSILLVFLTALLFYAMTLFKKVRRIKELKQKKDYQKQIDDILFSFLFEDKEVEEILASTTFRKNSLDPLYKRVAIKSIISLHHNYSGNYSTKLEKFYSDSGLAMYSMQKLNAVKWTYVVEGIRDLSSMNYPKAYQKIQFLKNHTNELVQTEALMGMIKLEGLQELFKFKNSPIYLNDWIQSNILFLVKKFKIPAPPKLETLLQSENESLVMLSIRLLSHYQLSAHNEALVAFYKKTGNQRIKKEIARELKKLEQV